MAGGIGSRFWPLSKDNYPKQFLDILGTGKSFIRSTYERFSPVIPDENFLVVTNKAYKHLVLEHLPMLRPDQVLCEPARRNTAPCIAYAAYHIQSRCADANIVVTPADHLVTNETEFQRIIRLGFDFLAKNPQALMTIGIKPSRPETGYGYIQVPKMNAECGMQNVECGITANRNNSAFSIHNSAFSNVVKVEMFKEKPDYDTAVKFVNEGNYFWNSGIFLWTLDGIMQASPMPRKTRMAMPCVARWFRSTTRTPSSTSRKALKPWWKAWKTTSWPIATIHCSCASFMMSSKSRSGLKD